MSISKVHYLLAALPLLAATTQADSIWQRRDAGHAYLFVDSNARCVGDLLTVVIAQNTDVQNREDRELNKESSLSEGFSFAGESSGGFAQQSAAAKLALSNDAEREFRGGASFTSERAFTDRVTVTVIDVLPNGNLVVSGSRRVAVAGDETILTVAGTVRGIDIAADNSISSRFISDFQLNYESTGPEQKFTRQGWLGRGMNRVWPF
ncbi:MAG: flagellar basal body L-ring protein FlgH [Planctomycetaceae bacterium]